MGDVLKERKLYTPPAVRYVYIFDPDETHEDDGKDYIRPVAGGCFVRLRAWSNGYDVVAATSEKQAHELLSLAHVMNGRFEPAVDLDGDGWRALNDDAPVLDADGKPTGETIGAAVLAAGEPKWMWSLEP